MADTQRQCENIVNNHAQASAVPCEAQCHTDAGESTEQQKKSPTKYNWEDILKEEVSSTAFSTLLEVGKFTTLGAVNTAVDRTSGKTSVRTMRLCAGIADWLQRNYGAPNIPADAVEELEKGLVAVKKGVKKASKEIPPQLLEGLGKSWDGVFQLRGAVVKAFEDK